MEILEHGPTDPKVAKVRLKDHLSPGFSPNSIDSRIYRGNRVTLLGKRVLAPDHQDLKIADLVIRMIREQIIAEPGLDRVDSDSVAKQIGHSLEVVRESFQDIDELGVLGRLQDELFYTSSPAVLLLGDVQTYDHYLYYDGLDDVLQHYFSAPPRSSSAFQFTLASAPTISIGDGHVAANKVTIKRGSAFVLMAIDPSKPELEDVYTAIKDVCGLFDISAYRADEVEHSESITDVILREIQSCEFLIADLSLERPNVYYEIGYAHALELRPVLFRKFGTRVHFDLLIHNIPEYRNVTQLKDLLTRRLIALTGRNPRGLDSPSSATPD
jgi:hypothetical protein